MERFYIDDIEILPKQTYGNRITYRFLRIKHAVALNVPYGVSFAYVRGYAKKLVSEGKRAGKFNDLRDGGYMRLLGKDIPLSVYDSAVYSVCYADGKIYLGLVGGRIGYHARRAITDFYKKYLTDYLKRRVPVMETYVGKNCESWQVVDIISAWGNCNYKTGNIKFSVNLASQPSECIDYVIIHELGHISFPDHGKEFHAYLDRYIPNHRVLETHLGNNN